MKIGPGVTRAGSDRGRTRRFVMLFVSVVLLVGALGVKYAAWRRARALEVRQAESAVAEIEVAFRVYGERNAGRCPGLERLVEAGMLFREVHGRDPWGTAYRVACRPGGGAVAHSAGPDGRDGTGDDVFAPRNEAR